MFIGAHVSTAGGIDTAIGRAQAIGAECLQIFGGPPRAYRASNYSDDQVENYKKLAYEAGLGPTWLHGIYLINLASENPETLQKSIDSLISYLQLCASINGAGVLFHVGSHQGRSFESVCRQIVQAISAILEASPPAIKLCLENSAGSGGTIGSAFAELGALVEGVGSERLGVCLDTQHTFASGYDLRTAEGVNKTMEAFDMAVGLDRLWVVHANDSKTELGSNRDRHENIGQGFIGIEGFAALLAHPALQELPVILEVPGDDGKSGPDSANIERLKQLRHLGI